MQKEKQPIYLCKTYSVKKLKAQLVEVLQWEVSTTVQPRSERWVLPAVRDKYYQQWEVSTTRSER